MTCQACTAKDELIRQLLVQQAETNAKILEMARDAAGLNRPPLPEPAPVEPLSELVATWLDLKFTRNSPLWRQQRVQARKLQADGLEPVDIVARLERGQQVEL